MASIGQREADWRCGQRRRHFFDLAPKMHIIGTFLSVGILWFLITLFTRSTNASQSLTETWIVVIGMLIVGSLHAEPSGDPAEDLRVFSYNIHMWQPGVDDLAAMIREADADIVGLNEAWNAERNEALAKELGYHIAYGGRDAEKRVRRDHWINGHYMPQVLLTRHRVVSVRCFNAVAAGEEPGKPDLDPEVPVHRGGLLAELETEKGHRVVVFVLHLHPWGTADDEKMTTMRLREIQGIVGRLKLHRERPVLIIGDFNTGSHLDGRKSWKVTPFLEKEGFFDLFRSLHPDPGKNPGLTCGDGRIDYIFHNRLVTPVACRVVGKGVFGSAGYEQSDHLGVFGVVRIGGDR